MKRTIVVLVTAVLTSVSAYGQTTYKPREVTYMGNTILVSNDIAVKFALGAKTKGSHLICDKVVPTRNKFVNEYFGVADYQALGFFLGSGVNGFGENCFVGSPDEIVAQLNKLRAELKVAEDAKRAKNEVEREAILAAEEEGRTRRGEAYQLRDYLHAPLRTNPSALPKQYEAITDAVDNCLEGAIKRNRPEWEACLQAVYDRFAINKRTPKTVTVSTQAETLAPVPVPVPVVQKPAAPATAAPAPVTQPSAPINPSFDCAKASNDTERAICSHQDLAALDAAFTLNYKNVLREFVKPGYDKTAVSTTKQQQRAWVKARNACGGDVKCIAKAYEDRNSDMCEFGVPSGLHPCTEQVAVP